MTAKLRELLSELSIEAPIGYQRLRIIPLRLKITSDLEYLTLDELSAALVTIEESSPSGSVPELRVRNRAKDRIFILDGSTLTGARQNRVVNLSVMLAPESLTVIPVSCVERGRWSYLARHCTPSWVSDSALRAMMCRGATDSLSKSESVGIDQGAVWHYVEGMLYGSGAASPTRAYHALYERWHQELADYEAHLPAPANACGAAVEVDGRVQAVDLFDKPDTLRRLWPGLAKSYALAALGPGTVWGNAAGVKGFLDRVLASDGASHETAGIGTTVRLATDEGVGAALLCDDRLVHLSIFANDISKLGGSHAPLSAPQEKEAGTEPKPSKSPHPWWRFWA
jgi:hypothetical protein